MKIFEKEIKKMEHFLKLSFPLSYRNFLFKSESAFVGGHKFLGIPKSLKEMSVLEATEVLRQSRPDLPLSYLAISFKEDVCLCLDTLSGDDPKLIEVKMKEEGRTTLLPTTFNGYIKYARSRENSYRVVLQKMKNRKREFEAMIPGKTRKLQRLENEKKEKPQARKNIIEQTLHSRSQDWHPRLFRLLDMVVAMSCFRYNFDFGCLEVDVFWAPDDLRCEPDDIIKWLATSIFAEALKLGGSADIMFTQDTRENDRGIIPRNLTAEKPRRKSIPIPEDLVAYAKKNEITFLKTSEGRISHSEAKALWWKVIGLSDLASKKAKELEKEKFLSIEWLCYIITQNLWTKEEADWILQNAPKPEAVLLASDPPEWRLSFAETLSWARAALITSRFVRKIVLNFTDGYAPEDDVPTPEYTLKADGLFQVLQFQESYELPWLHRNQRKKLIVEAGKHVLLYSIPRYSLRSEWDKEWIFENLRLIKSYNGNFSFRCLILSMEFNDCSYIDDFVHTAEEQGITILFGQRRLDMYDDEVMERLHKIRVLRRFTPRIKAMKIKVLEIPSVQWKEERMGLGQMVRTTETFARWISKQIQVKRARFDFTTHAHAVERIACGLKESNDLGELNSEESERVQIALCTYDNVQFPNSSFSYVRPEKLGDFLLKLPTELQRKFNIIKKGSGLVFIHVELERTKSLSKSYIQKKETFDSNILAKKFPIPFIQQEGTVRYLGRRITIFQKRLETALRTGQPLAISFLPLSHFPDMIQKCLYYDDIKKEKKTEKSISKFPSLEWFFKMIGKKPPQKIIEDVQVFHIRKPDKSVGLRIIYQDGSEGEPFPLFDLSQIKKPEGLLKLNLGTVSMRHPNTDFAVHAYILINPEIQFRKDNGASEQEAFAYRRTIDFVGTLLNAAKGKDLNEIHKKDSVYSALIQQYRIGNPPSTGLEIHLFQATGLEPVTIGIYRALRMLIKEHRGEIVVVPRVLSGKGHIIIDSNLQGEERRTAVVKTYSEGLLWY